LPTALRANESWLAAGEAMHALDEVAQLNANVSACFLSFGAATRAFQPEAKESVGRAKLLEYLRGKKIESYSDLVKDYGGLGICDGTDRDRARARGENSAPKWLKGRCPEPFGEYNAPGMANRYLYSPVWGWLDVRHLSAMAYLSNLLTPRMALKVGEHYEKREAGTIAGYAYEDLPSNLMGACFAPYRRRLENAGRPLLDVLESYLKGLHFVENAPLDVAPNAAAIHEYDEKNVKNHTYGPLFAPGGAAETGEDRFLQNCRRDLDREPSSASAIRRFGSHPVLDAAAWNC
jgi:hypothetical protein